MIVFIGNSHTDSVRKSLQINPVLGVEAYRIIKLKNGKLLGDLDDIQIAERLSALSSTDLVISTISGNRHVVFGLIQHPRQYDFNEPGGSDIDPQAEIIPYKVIHDTFTHYLRKDANRIEWLKSLAPCPVVHLMAPPPKENAEAILSRPGSYFSKKGVADHGVSRAPLRLKLWRLQVRVLQEFCAEIGVETIRPPEQALDRGYLRLEYAANDASHANARYGALLIDQALSRQALVGKTSQLRIQTKNIGNLSDIGHAS